MRILLFSFFFTLLSTFLFHSPATAQYNPADTMDILHYDINLDIVYLSTKQIKGHTSVKFTPKMPNVNHVYLGLLKMTIDSITTQPGSVAGYNYNDTIISLRLTPSISPGDTNTLTVYYHGQPQKDSYWGGFYFPSDSAYAFNLGVGFDANPHNFGKVWFPCHDDFTDKATYDFNIRVKSDKMAVCGGILQGITDHSDGTKTCHWKLGNPIPTYLASVAVGNYVAVKDTFNGMLGTIPVEIYVRPQDTTKAKASFANLNKITHIFEKRFGPYRFERFGFVGVPFSSGAMEHATNVAIGNGYINGTLSYESLIAHEQSHHWFGNLVTCALAEDMWLNEGWARYSESVYRELLYGNEAFKNNVRSTHYDVLQNTHISEGYLAVYGIPHEFTYGTTVYDKGAGVTHSLRGYLGDSLFFDVVKQYLAQYAFKSASSHELRDFITAKTGINMNDFFDAWVFSPGFPHFSIDSVSLYPGPSTYTTAEVHFKQKHKGPGILSNSNRVEVTFMDDSWNTFTQKMTFSGQTGSDTVTLPFYPQYWFIDLEERLCDATTDNYKVISSTGIKSFPSTYTQIDIQQVTDSAFIRVEHSWVAPDDFKNPVPGFYISRDRYWKVDGMFPTGFIAKTGFYYSKLNTLDGAFIKNTADSLRLVYRRNVKEEWKIINTQRLGDIISGYLYVDTLKPGEYALAIFDYDHPYGINTLNPKKDKRIKVFPNPASSQIVIEFLNPAKGYVKIFNSGGQLVDTLHTNNSINRLNWTPQSNYTGVIFIQLYSIEDQLIDFEKIVLVK